jgi:DnaJ-class molecular chaperone
MNLEQRRKRAEQIGRQVRGVTQTELRVSERADPMVPAAPAKAKCQTCDGTGKCPECDGSGQTAVDPDGLTPSMDV